MVHFGAASVLYVQRVPSRGADFGLYRGKGGTAREDRPTEGLASGGVELELDVRAGGIIHCPVTRY